jgi:anti-sigma factor RsiW
MPYLDGELLEGERLGVEQHLARCPQCARRTEVDRHNRTFVRALAEHAQPVASQALRSRITSGIRSIEAEKRRGRYMRVSVAAASVLVCATLGHAQWRSFQRRLYVEDAASRHARQFPLEVRVPQPEVLEAWFSGKLGHRVAVPRFPNAVAAGARVLNVRDKQAAYIRYDAPTRSSAQVRQVGLFVFGDNANDVDVGARADADLRNSNGYNVVSWREGDLVYQLVTDLEEDDIRNLLPPAEHLSEAPALPTSPAIDVRPASFQR